MLCVSESDASSRWNHSRHSMNSHHAENGFANRNVDDDDDSAINVQVKDHDEMQGRFESPVLRPLPSTSFVIIT